MGLDVTWYSEAELAPHAELDSDGLPVLWDDYVRVSPYQSFPERCADIAPGVYSFADSGDLWAGSYTGYNDWREQLARMAGYPTVAGDCAAVESDSDRHLHSRGAWAAGAGPFYELIDFTDCDGVIGTAVSKRLAADFAENQAKADDVGGCFAEKYAQWRHAFEQAANSGFVVFH